MRIRSSHGRWLLAVVAASALLASCTSESDVDMDELGQQLNEDGQTIVDEFDTNEPRGGHITSTSPGADASTDEECGDGGVQRRWTHEFSFAWPGDPTNDDHVNDSFNGALDFLSSVLNPLGYSAERSDMGQGAKPRTAVYVRTATDEEIELEFRVDFELAANQADDETITADFTLTGTTECVGADG
ncbi:hypothetical protein EF847_06830 [Actinobacteria bacterium YIM 96077]|uniref:LppX_LprAFG lipoprotein n=1 Tax=Phytoactinopolyspora halophila TaxID=1981511 RepID=A0A329QBH1_9ACTN|nr:hypothetical protein [Phytoactinopolyspora halophila]AYY12462.1 hypothetical protein EF847_06830 [Actinobacteria bacterium YIM 96077]RAW09341.1 hypothetical protein DPM12_21760 [Phytoactinopolyspora halophila]